MSAEPLTCHMCSDIITSEMGSESIIVGCAGDNGVAHKWVNVHRDKYRCLNKLRAQVRALEERCADARRELAEALHEREVADQRADARVRAHRRAERDLTDAQTTYEARIAEHHKTHDALSRRYRALERERDALRTIADAATAYVRVARCADELDPWGHTVDERYDALCEAVAARPEGPETGDA